MALAFDAATGSEAATGSLTISHTTGAGSDRLGIVKANSGNNSDSITDVTWDGVSIFANLIAKVQITGNSYEYLFYMINPPSGAKNVVISNSNPSYTIGAVSTFTGADQSSPIDSFNTGSANAVSALAVSTTVVASNCWLVYGVRNDGGVAFTGDAGTTVRIQEPSGGGLCDSNGTVGTGSQSQGVTWSGSYNVGGVVASIKPSGAVVANKNLMMMGVGV